MVSQSALCVDVAPEESLVAPGPTPIKLRVRDLAISYGHTPALHGVNLDVHEHEIFGIIGPANAGKTSFLKAVNRMDLLTPGMRVAGDISFSGHDIRQLHNIYALRSRIG
ncbi:MAG: ATP-binding cassette domain-containing protein, partial [Chromatiaceae bacterium]|nr:ATP-binding cassette domain-containing protein [Chromatiaceae bacterium]